MRIAEDLYLVGSGNFGVSHPTDCNVYAIDMQGAFVLIDAGSGVDPTKLLKNIEKEGIPANKIEYLVLTHAHWDHAGGCMALSNILHCKICANKLAIPLLNKANFRGALAEYNTRKRNVRVNVRVDVELYDKQILSVGSRNLQFISTPGHSADGISIICKLGCGLALFPGDTVLANGRIGVITNDTNLQEYAGTIETLCNLRPDCLFPSHGIFVVSNAYVHLNLSLQKIKSNWYDVLAGSTPFNPSWWWNYLKENKAVNC
jgi:hydroxyacylglutathione hydrolase